MSVDEWHTIFPFLSYRKLIWVAQCSALLNAIAARSIQHAQWKKTELWQCAKEGDLQGVKYLVEQCGVNVRAYNEYALRVACEFGHLEVVRYLVEVGGADVHTGDDWALRLARWMGHSELVEYLESKGAKK